MGTRFLIQPEKNGNVKERMCVLRQLRVVASWFEWDGNVVSVVYDFGMDKEKSILTQLTYLLHWKASTWQFVSIHIMD